MCGIAGFFSPRVDKGGQALAELARHMADAIAHRGPDDFAAWADPAMHVALSHRRLSIIDLSPEGRQPMHSASGRYVTVFNGEIYNFNELRAELEQSGEGPRWRGHSDTEVLLAACDMWGVEKAVERANAMFALAIVDRQERVLVLARDRMGEKPLYYGWQGGTFLFGSELKALRRHPEFENRLDSPALPLYLRFGYVPAPWSIYRGIRKLLPAHVLIVPMDGTPGSEHTKPYWRVPEPRPDNGLDAREAADELDRLLSDAVRIRMHADVPLGAFLSGGIDSSTIVALMQQQAMQRVRSYSIGFRERSHNEAEYARAVAKTLKTDHTEMYVTSADALAVVPRLPEMYDEPFSDSSQIPTHLLASLTRRHVTVALSGDGGDELFGGYVRYARARHLARAWNVVPRVARAFGAWTLRRIAGQRWDALLAAGPRDLAMAASADRLLKVAEVLELEDTKAMYRRLVSQWGDPSQLVVSVPEPRTRLDDTDDMIREKGAEAWMMYIDQLTYLPDDILAKVDRASMAVALEVRVPFLDPRVVEFAARVPLAMKVRRGTGKWLLRQVLYRRLDPRLVERPKQGFSVPIADWLRGPLREWAEDLLSEESLRSGGLVDVTITRRAWREHLHGARQLHNPLWTVLMLQAWQRQSHPLV